MLSLNSIPKTIFQKILSNLRIGEVGEEELKFLESRCIKYEGDDIIKIFPTNKLVLEYNTYSYITLSHITMEYICSS